MAPGTGTPDCAASSIRIHSARRYETWVCGWLPTTLLSISIVLAGCTSQPLAPGTSANARSGHAVPEPTSNDPGPPPTHERARSGRSSLPAFETRPPVPPDPTVVGLLDRGPGNLPASRLDTDAAGERDTWARIRENMDLPHSADKRVKRAISWYRRNPEYLHRLTQRARPYLPYIVREVEKRGMPMVFALLPVVESAFRVRAYSPAGASGLWQFMPSTGRRYGLKQNWWYDGRRDVVESTRAALDYLTKLLAEFGDDPLLAVAAYNWGEGNVRRSIARNRARGKPTDVWSLRLPTETQIHVSHLVAFSAIVERPDAYGVVFDSIPDRVYFRPVPIDGQINLAFAAGLAGITLAELRRLNPGFKRATTAPGTPHRLQFPSDAAERFTAKLAQLPAERQGSWTRHAIVYGDTLGEIAGRYGTSVSALKYTNGLASDRIIAGNDLMVPAAPGGLDALAPLATPDLSVAEGQVKTIHRVRNGDSLWRIARRHGVDMQQLAAWNGLSVETVLHPGQRLTVYRERSRTVPSIAPAKPLKTSQSGTVHVVQHGDTLSEIAERHGTTVLELTEFNRIHEGAVLQPGQELSLIPVAYTNPRTGRERIRYRVKRGDSLWEISRQFGVSVASLRRWNQLSRNEPLVPGRELFVHLAYKPAI